MRLILFIFLFIPAVLWAQNFNVTGQVIDGDNSTPMEFATVSLLKAGDSSLVSGAVTDFEGRFKIAAPEGEYILKAQFVTYNARELSGIVLGPNSPVYAMGQISLTASNKELEEVVVQADRTQMQLNLDKKIYNVGKDLSNLGGSASDILDNLPSVTVDVEGNVELRGSSSVRILIDGKPSGLVGLSSTDALKQLQSNLIESVEIITNPSARYDAAGQAGIINIILKKDQQKGLNGSFQATTGWPHNHGLGINMNFRKKWVNFFVNYGFNYNKAPGKSLTNQQFFRQDTTYYRDQIYDRLRGGYSNNVRVGADFNVGENSTLTSSFLYRYSRDKNMTDLEILSFDSNRQLGLYNLNEDTEKELDKNLEYALNYIKRFKRKGHEFSANVQYQDNFENEKSDIDRSFGPNSVTIDSTNLQIVDNVQGEERLMLQADYIQPFGEKARYEMGYRSTFRNVINNYSVDEANESGTLQPIDSVTFDFLYKEYVHAFYGIISDELDRISWQVGLRAEISDIETDISGVEDKKLYNYTNFFPSAFFTYKLKGFSQVQLSYSRRINRPRYRDLSPLSSFTNNTSFRVGNPELQPEFTDSYELGILQNLKTSSIYYGIYYRHTEDPIMRVSQQANEDDITISREENIGLQRALGFEINATQDFTDWYRLSGNFNFYRQTTSGEIYGESLAAKTVTFTTRVSNNFTFKELFMAQVNFNFRAPENRPQGRREAISVLDLGLSRDLWEKKGTLALSVRDVFNTRKYRFETTTSNYVSDSEWQWRRGPSFVLTLNYRLNQSNNKKGEREEKGDGRDFDGGDF